MDISDQTYKFYDQIAKDFDNTRQKPWPGWEKLVTYLPSEDFTILDIACGNGRFYAFLKEKGLSSRYTGIDKSKVLLNIAKKVYPETFFLEKDAICEISGLDNKFDVIVIFGFMHHIPENIRKTEYFAEILKLLNKKGVLIFSIWHLEKDERFERRAKSVKNTENDYLYDWGSLKEAHRYFHLYNNNEIDEIIKFLEENNMKLQERYLSDGKSGNLNEYFVFKQS